MAARSMVRTPPASVGSEASGGTSTGRRSGSWTVITRVYGEARRGRLVRARKAMSTLWRALGNRGCGRLNPFRHLIVAREVVEASDCRVELQLNSPGRAVALFRNDDFGLALMLIALCLPS